MRCAIDKDSVLLPMAMAAAHAARCAGLLSIMQWATNQLLLVHGVGLHAM